MVVLRESLDGMPQLSSIAYPIVQKHYVLSKQGMYFPGKTEKDAPVLIRPVELLGTTALERYYIKRGTDLLIADNDAMIAAFSVQDRLEKRHEVEDNEEAELARLRREKLAKMQGRRGFR